MIENFIVSLRRKRYSFMAVQFTDTRSTERLQPPQKAYVFFSTEVLSSHDVIPLDGAIIPVPTAFNCIETVIEKS